MCVALAAAGIFNTEFGFNGLVASVALFIKYFECFCQNHIQECFLNWWRQRGTEMGTEEKRTTLKDNTPSISDILRRDRPPEHSADPRQARKTRLYRSAPLTRTFLAGVSIVKVSIFSIFHLQVASAFQKKSVKKYEEYALKTPAQLQRTLCGLLPCQSLSVPCQSRTLICPRGVGWQPCLFTQRGRLPV